MLPTETKPLISTEISSLQDMVIPNEIQSQMCLLPSNLNKHTLSKQRCRRNANYHIPSALVREYIAPCQTEYGINNKIMPFGYYLQTGQCINKNNSNLHQILPFSVSLNSSLASLEASASTTNCNGVYSTQRTEYENHMEQCPVTNQPHVWRSSYTLPTASSSSIPTSVVPPAKTKRSKTIYHS
jgi:hypothetical protein